MTITRFSTGAIRDNALATNTSFAASDMELIGTVRVGSGGSGTITFSNIPQEYKHLQIRGISRATSTGTAGAEDIWVRFNSDTGSNYSFHLLQGDGSSAVSTASSSTTYGRIGMSCRDGYASNVYSAFVCDILDYSSALKNKTTRSIYGQDTNTIYGYSSFQSSLWRSTAAVTSISVIPEGTTSFKQFTKFALYGIRG